MTALTFTFLVFATAVSAIVVLTLATIVVMAWRSSDSLLQVPEDTSTLSTTQE